jgi:hypothetical protein
MGIRRQLTISTQDSVSEFAGSRRPGATFASDKQLQVALLFTSFDVTVYALERTAALLAGLNARIDLIAVQSVPYLLALNNPPVSIPFNEQRLRDIAAESAIETAVHLYVCRYPFEALTSVLHPGSILVVGTRKRWWPSWELKLARKLESAGLRILVLEVS